MIPGLAKSLPFLLPLAHAWCEEQEEKILRKGLPLTDEQTAMAWQLGVQFPEKIRLAVVEEIPLVSNAQLLFIARQLGLYSEKIHGFTAGYGIYVQSAFWKDTCTLAHELVHVSQYERLGGIHPFLQEYVRQLIEPGYPFGQLEQEAIRRANNICLV